MHPRSPGIGLRPIQHKRVISETLVLGSWPICWLSTEETKPKTIKQTTQEQNGKHTKSKPKSKKPKSKQTVNFKNCSLVCAYHCAQLPYTTQHRTVLIIFPLILQTITVAQMLSILEGMRTKLTRTGRSSKLSYTVYINLHELNNTQISCVHVEYFLQQQ